ncbi:PsbP-related protein [Methanobacterium sp.]|uniref:PsbP-related protein n=1 Tax=Methanobacterium sp. TaxID=2164 RepID=UPI003C7941B5
MNKIAWIVPVLILIIAASGCTYKDQGPGTNNIYNKSGIYFEYPHEYTIKNVTSANGVFVEGISGWDYNCTFKISKESIDSSGKANGISLHDLKNTTRLTRDNYTVEEVQNIIIDNVTALDMIYAHYNPPYVKYESISFDKNGTRYNILFEYKGIGVTDTRAVVAITGTFRVLE